MIFEQWGVDSTWSLKEPLTTKHVRPKREACRVVAVRLFFFFVPCSLFLFFVFPPNACLQVKIKIRSSMPSHRVRCRLRSRFHTARHMRSFYTLTLLHSYAPTNWSSNKRNFDFYRSDYVIYISPIYDTRLFSELKQRQI